MGDARLDDVLLEVAHDVARHAVRVCRPMSTTVDGRQSTLADVDLQGVDCRPSTVDTCRCRLARCRLSTVDTWCRLLESTVSTRVSIFRSVDCRLCLFYRGL